MYEVPNGLWTKWLLGQETVEIDSHMISDKIPVTSMLESRAPEGRNKTNMPHTNRLVGK